MMGFLALCFWLFVIIVPGVVAVVRVWKKQGEEATMPEGVKFCAGALWLVGGTIAYIFLFYWLDVKVESWWFGSLGFEGRFWTEFNSYWSYFALGAICFLLFTLANLALAGTAVPWKKGTKDNKAEIMAAFVIAVILLVVVAVVFGWITGARWETFLKYKASQPTGITDPLFGKDVSFFLFTLPMLRSLWWLAAMMLLATSILVGAFYAISYVTLRDSEKKKRYALERERYSSYNRYDARSSKPAQVQPETAETELSVCDILKQRIVRHAAALGIVAALMSIFTVMLNRWSLVYTTHQTFTGAGYTEVNVDMPFMNGAIFILTVLAGLCAVRMFLPRKTLSYTICGMFVLALVAWPIIGSVWSWYTQRYTVSNNESEVQRPYIERNIKFTRAAFGIDKVKIQDLKFNPVVGPEVKKSDESTLQNVRLWDWGVNLQANRQAEARNNFYTFSDEDVDRYHINGKLTQVMISAREVSQQLLADSGKTWSNRKFAYTHGFGLVANPVNTYTAEGLPAYLLHSLPPKAERPELQLKQPRLYFSEESTETVYVGGKQPEIDYATDQSSGKQVLSMNQYDGPDGLALGSGLRRLMLSWYFDGWRVWTSEEFLPQTRVMFWRDVKTRTEKLAPFLKFEDDMYPVITGGEVYFIRDGYTESDQYPYSKEEDGVNYIRNSVKAVVNAYTGKTKLYVVDASDPIIATYMRIFPDLFVPASSAPAELRQHFRYPEHLMSVQAKIFATYHMTDPGVFYNRGDVWDTAKENKDPEALRDVRPYYTVIRLPGETEEEFALLQPFTPHNTQDQQRINMVSLMAARSDGSHYGELVSYVFPEKSQTIFGPQQIGGRLNSDQNISKDMTMWHQRGSQVIFGNTLVLPLSEGRLLYAMPIYIQSTNTKLPKLAKIYVASGEQWGYGDSFEAALNEMFQRPVEGSVGAAIQSGGSVAVQRTAAPAASITGTLANQASQHLDRYYRLMGEGKAAEAGRELEQLRQVLGQMPKQ